jgi:hypothetical protein
MISCEFVPCPVSTATGQPQEDGRRRMADEASAGEETANLQVGKSANRKWAQDASKLARPFIGRVG